MNGLAHNVLVRTEPPMPHVVAQHYHLFFSRLLLFWEKRAAQDWLQAQHLKEISGCAATSNAFRAPSAREGAKVDEAECAHDLEDSVLLFDIKKVGSGEAICASARLRSPHHNNVICILIR